MPVQQIFYNSAVPVNAKRHGQMSVKSGTDFNFARNTNAVPVAAVEFAPASAEYPIVFAGSPEVVFPAVILGIRENQNLQVDADGAWRGRHIPAFVRRYPFVFSADENQERFGLHIDEEFEGVNNEGRGERLFDSQGEQTLYLKNVLKFLQDYQAHFKRTQAFCKALVEHDLLQPMQAQFGVKDGQKRSLAGFMAVDREKLKALSDAQLGELMRKDELECIYLHLQSMRHFSDLAQLDARNDAPVPPEDVAAPDEADTAVPDGTTLN